MATGRCSEGERLIQFDLADTLRAIAKDGPRAFYQGRTAAQIAAAVVKAGGIMSKDDLANYRAIERAVVRGRYRGYDIVSVPPPSSGGVHLIEMLNILEGYDLGQAEPRGIVARHDRSDEARLCRPRCLYGRPRRSENPGGRFDLEDICRVSARTDRRPRHAVSRHPRRQASRISKAATRRIFR